MASSSSRDMIGRGKPSQKENRQLKGLTAANVTRAQKRTVLGSITNNVRVQPSRAAKTTHNVLKVDGQQDENAILSQKEIGKSKKQPFSIYVDQDDVLPRPPLQGHPHMEALAGLDDENHLPSLNEAVMLLPSIPQPMMKMPDSKVSSYCLDMSGVEEDVDDSEEDENDCSMTQPDQHADPALYGLDHQTREAIIEEVPEYAEEIYTYLLSVEYTECNSHCDHRVTVAFDTLNNGYKFSHYAKRAVEGVEFAFFLFPYIDQKSTVSCNSTCSTHKHRPRPGFMQRQQDVTLAMRSILIDWLVEVAEEYKLQRETLFLTVNYIDRFLSHMSVQRSKLQLVGAASMFLAAKYEEIYPPDVNEFVYITDDTYQKKQILRMEHLVLKVLKFDVAAPTINWFTERLLRNVCEEDSVKHMTMYICELVLIEYDKFLIFPASLIAASALFLAHYTLQVSDRWSLRCETVSRYSLTELAPCVRMLYELHCNAPQHPQQAVREKYRLAKFERVADVCAQPSCCV